MMLGQLVGIELILKKLGEQDVSPKTRYHLAKLMKLVNAETKIFYEERDKLIKSLGTEDVDKQLFQVKDDNMKEYILKLNELAEIEVIINDYLLTTKMLDEFKMSALDLITLEPLTIEEK